MHWTDFAVIIASGSFGGLLSSLYIHDGSLILPKIIELELSDGSRRKNYHIGFLSDIILGAGAGLISALPLGLEFPKYIYVAMIAGFRRRQLYRETSQADGRRKNILPG